jgi:hypothetical protein
MRTDKIRRIRFRIHALRLVVVFMAAAAGMFAQAVPTDPEYVIPKENPFARPPTCRPAKSCFWGNAPDVMDQKERADAARFWLSHACATSPMMLSLFMVIRDGIKR